MSLFPDVADVSILSLFDLSAFATEVSDVVVVDVVDVVVVVGGDVIVFEGYGSDGVNWIFANIDVSVDGDCEEGPVELFDVNVVLVVVFGNDPNVEVLDRASLVDPSFSAVDTLLSLFEVELPNEPKSDVVIEDVDDGTLSSAVPFVDFVVDTLIPAGEVESKRLGGLGTGIVAVPTVALVSEEEEEGGNDEDDGVSLRLAKIGDCVFVSSLVLDVLAGDGSLVWNIEAASVFFFVAGVDGDDGVNLTFPNMEVGAFGSFFGRDGVVAGDGIFETKLFLSVVGVCCCGRGGRDEAGVAVEDDVDVGTNLTFAKMEDDCVFVSCLDLVGVLVGDGIFETKLLVSDFVSVCG